MENTIKINTNDELNVLRIKIDVIEKDLQMAISRAERAETELEQMKLTHMNCVNSRDSIGKAICRMCRNTYYTTRNADGEIILGRPTSSEATAPAPPPPPPPPPPLPPAEHKFNLPPTNSVKYGVSLSEGIAAFARNNTRQGAGGCINVKNQQVPKATGWYKTSNTQRYMQHVYRRVSVYIFYIMYLYL